MSPLRVALPLSVLLVAGCQSAGHLTGARTLDAEKSRFGVTVGASNHVSGDVIMLAGSIQAQLNHGITDHVEVGVSGGTNGLGLMTKVALVRSESAQAGFNLAIEPGGSVGPRYGDARLPLLLGYRFGGHELTLGPAVHFTWPVGTTWPSAGLLAGATLSGRFRVASGFILSPEVGWMQPIAGRQPLPIPVANLGFSWE